MKQKPLQLGEATKAQVSELDVSSAERCFAQILEHANALKGELQDMKRMVHDLQQDRDRMACQLAALMNHNLNLLASHAQPADKARMIQTPKAMGIIPEGPSDNLNIQEDSLPRGGGEDTAVVATSSSPGSADKGPGNKCKRHSRSRS